MTARARCVLIGVVAAAASCGRGSDPPACAPRLDRMRAILTAPYNRALNERPLPIIDTVDGEAAAPDAIVVRIDGSPPTIAVADGPSINWRFGGANPEVVAELARRRAASPGAPIVIDAPFGVEAWGVVNLIKLLPATTTVRIAVVRPDLDLPADTPAWLATALKAVLAAPPSDRASMIARAFERAAGPCNASIQTALGEARAPRTRVGEDDRVVAGVMAALAGCGCDDVDPVGVAVVLRAIIAGLAPGWIEIRHDPTSARVLNPGRKNEGFGELVFRLGEFDAATRRAGINLGSQ